LLPAIIVTRQRAVLGPVSASQIPWTKHLLQFTLLSVCGKSYTQVLLSTAFHTSLRLNLRLCEIEAEARRQSTPIPRHTRTRIGLWPYCRVTSHASTRFDFPHPSLCCHLETAVCINDKTTFTVHLPLLSSALSTCTRSIDNDHLLCEMCCHQTVETTLVALGLSTSFSLRPIQPFSSAESF
jgi:hypothetical protein